MLPPPPRPTLFPYTTLFRSGAGPILRNWNLTIDSYRTLLNGGNIWNWYLASVVTSVVRSEEHTSELQSQFHLVCRLLLEKKKKKKLKDVMKKVYIVNYNTHS